MKVDTYKASDTKSFFIYKKVDFNRRGRSRIAKLGLLHYAIRVLTPTMSAQRPRLKGTPRKKTDTTQSRCCHRSKMSHVALIDVSSRFTRSHKGGGNWDTSEERANDIVNFKCQCAAMKRVVFVSYDNGI
jgi:hypothetical protein